MTHSELREKLEAAGVRDVLTAQDNVHPDYRDKIRGLAEEVAAEWEGFKVTGTHSSDGALVPAIDGLMSAFESLRHELSRRDALDGAETFIDQASMRVINAMKSFMEEYDEEDAAGPDEADESVEECDKAPAVESEGPIKTPKKPRAPKKVKEPAARKSRGEILDEGIAEIIAGADKLHKTHWMGRAAGLMMLDDCKATRYLVAVCSGMAGAAARDDAWVNAAPETAGSISFDAVEDFVCLKNKPDRKDA